MNYVTSPEVSGPVRVGLDGKADLTPAQCEELFANRMKAPTKSALNPFQRWMVRSNLETIRNGAPRAEVLATLRANGYPAVADAVESNT